jgi:Spy/CpxP family protein refolding chaperone
LLPAHLSVKEIVMARLRLIAFSVVCVLVLPLSAWAQGVARPVQPQQNYYTMSQAIYWLSNDQMLKELDILPEQKEKLNKIRTEMQTSTQEAFKAMNDGSVKPEDRQAKYFEIMNKVNDETGKKMEEVLLPHQTKRLKQILTQMRLGAMGYGYGAAGALGQDDIAKELGITDEQREELKKAEEEVRQDMQKKTQEFYKKLQEEAREKLFKVLTPAQRKKIEEMQGEKFEWKWQQPAAGGAGTVPVAPK